MSRAETISRTRSSSSMRTPGSAKSCPLASRSSISHPFPTTQHDFPHSPRPKGLPQSTRANPPDDSRTNLGQIRVGQLSRELGERLSAWDTTLQLPGRSRRAPAEDPLRRTPDDPPTI